MKGSITKWIIPAGALILLIVFLSFNPFSDLESFKLASDVPPSPLKLPEIEKASPLPVNDDELCQRCHSQLERAKINYEDPTCLECHTEDDERILPIDEIPHRPTPFPVSTSSSSKPNEMIHIPAGVFLMGSEGRTNVEGPGDPDEAPIHQVYVEGFNMDKYEVTNAQYRAFVDATGRRPPPALGGKYHPAWEGKPPRQLCELV